MGPAIRDDMTKSLFPTAKPVCGNSAGLPVNKNFGYTIEKALEKEGLVLYTGPGSTLTSVWADGELHHVSVGRITYK